MHYLSRTHRALLLVLALVLGAGYALADYTGRTQRSAVPAQVPGYADDGGTYPGDAYRSSIAEVDTAGDVTASPGLGDLPRIACLGHTQISAAVLAPITTGSYTLGCVRLRLNSSGALVATDETQAACTVPSSPLSEGGLYLTNRVTFDTDGAGAVVILVRALNHPNTDPAEDQDECSISAEAN